MRTETSTYPFEDQAIIALKAKGLRITQPRRNVIRCLAESSKSLTVPLLHASVNAVGHSIDLASVYRIIDALEHLGLVHRIASTDGYSACQVGHVHDGPVEHLICISCGDVAERTLSERYVEALANETAASGFRPRTVQVEVMGECKNCAEQSGKK